MTELLQSHEETLIREELLLMSEQRKWFLEMESTSRENAVKIVKMMKENLEYYINSVYKAMAGFQRIDSNFDKQGLWSWDSNPGQRAVSSCPLSQEEPANSSVTLWRPSWGKNERRGQGLCIPYGRIRGKASRSSALSWPHAQS